MGRTAKWFGDSGRGYSFTVAAIPCQIDLPGRNGNFIVCRDSEGEWIPILITQGELAVMVPAAEKDASVLAKGATHVHWRYTGGGEEVRMGIEADLRAGHPACFEPFGCTI